MKFTVENMKCGGCSSAVHSKLDALAGVEQVSVDLATKTVEVHGQLEAELIIETLTEAGYPAELID
ncbi:cation transporter [uncultured Thiothrix sp.]|jgi:copper chaperone|uniref:heavy-metal-associated domain-containing protein n=1 Tax=uncultured Thiothrix sp. TaxID=223185 RepID=UPI002612B86E|nr:cation transporter [uncultured Thiothrix sp.]HMT93029.1 cation transporter [Thiolinea sp.]